MYISIFLYFKSHIIQYCNNFCWYSIKSFLYSMYLFILDTYCLYNIAFFLYNTENKNNPLKHVET